MLLTWAWNSLCGIWAKTINPLRWSEGERAQNTHTDTRRCGFPTRTAQKCPPPHFIPINVHNIWVAENVSRLLFARKKVSLGKCHCIDSNKGLFFSLFADPWDGQGPPGGQQALSHSQGPLGAVDGLVWVLDQLRGRREVANQAVPLRPPEATEASHVSLSLFPFLQTGVSIGILSLMMFRLRKRINISESVFVLFLCVPRAADCASVKSRALGTFRGSRFWCSRVAMINQDTAVAFLFHWRGTKRAEVY